MNLELFGGHLDSCFYNFTRARVGICNLENSCPLVQYYSLSSFFKALISSVSR